MLRTAVYVEEITVIDPDSKGEVELDIFKHENGGMFAVDASYLDQCFDDDVAPQIPDPFYQPNDMTDLNYVELQGL